MSYPAQFDRLALSVAELARALGISRSKAYALVRQADFPARRVGDRVLIPVDALRDWLNSRSEVEANERDDVI